MRGHGITTCGATVEEATLTAIRLNELADMNYRAHLLGNPQPISDEEIGHFKRGSKKREDTHSAPLWRYYCSLAGEEE
jgi:ribulose-5-phosphate 4-epimerase/fuculose-1-phosphate aldolase